MLWGWGRARALSSRRHAHPASKLLGSAPDRDRGDGGDTQTDETHGDIRRPGPTRVPSRPPTPSAMMLHEREAPPTKATMLPRPEGSVAVTMRVNSNALTTPSSSPTAAASGMYAAEARREPLPHLTDRNHPERSQDGHGPGPGRPRGHRDEALAWDTYVLLLPTEAPPEP